LSDQKGPYAAEGNLNGNFLPLTYSIVIWTLDYKHAHRVEVSALQKQRKL